MSKNDNVNDVFVLIMITIIIGSMIYSAYFSYNMDVCVRMLFCREDKEI